MQKDRGTEETTEGRRADRQSQSETRTSSASVQCWSSLPSRNLQALRRTLQLHAAVDELVLSEMYKDPLLQWKGSPLRTNPHLSFGAACCSRIRLETDLLLAMAHSALVRQLDQGLAQRSLLWQESQSKSNNPVQRDLTAAICIDDPEKCSVVNGCLKLPSCNQSRHRSFAHGLLPGGLLAYAKFMPQLSNLVQ